MIYRPLALTAAVVFLATAVAGEAARASETSLPGVVVPAGSVARRPPTPLPPPVTPQATKLAIATHLIGRTVGQITPEYDFRLTPSAATNKYAGLVFYEPNWVGGCSPYYGPCTDAADYTPVDKAYMAHVVRLELGVPVDVGTVSAIELDFAVNADPTIAGKPPTFYIWSGAGAPATTPVTNGHVYAIIPITTPITQTLGFVYTVGANTTWRFLNVEVSALR
jgi:hypothetical protein